MDNVDRGQVSAPAHSSNPATEWIELTPMTRSASFSAFERAGAMPGFLVGAVAGLASFCAVIIGDCGGWGVWGNTERKLIDEKKAGWE